MTKDYRKDIPILSDSIANNPPPKLSWVFVAFADNDVDPHAKQILDEIQVKYQPKQYAFLGDGCYAEPEYQCIICNSKDMYVNYQKDIIQCNSCGKKWNIREWIKDLDQVILEVDPSAKHLLDEIHEVENRK